MREESAPNPPHPQHETGAVTTDDAGNVHVTVDRLDPLRRALLLTGWVTVAVCLFAPGFYRSSNAWAPARSYPAIGALLRAISVGWEPHNLRLDWLSAAGFVTGWLLLAGTLLFALSPLLLSARARALSGMRWTAWAMLSVWLPPLLEVLDDRTYRWHLWGYYGVAIGFTLVFVAVQLPLRLGRDRRGFEPVMRRGA